ncbi:MAG: phosphotransferase enzyme family protein [Parahaliea sp.]
MSDFYTLDDAAKTRCFQALATAALPLWGFEGASLSLIKQRENAVFKLELANGELAAMRVHRAGYHSDDELRSELQWMAALNDYGVHTPEIIPAKDGALFRTVSAAEVHEARQVDILRWVDGDTVGSIESGIEADIDDTFHTIGALVARMHNFAEQWPLPAGFSRHSWDAPGLLGEDPWWGRFWDLSLLSQVQVERLQAAREHALAELAAYGNGPDRYGLIHADTLPENFLAERDKGVVRVIDFDDGGFGWHLFDFATALFFSLGEPEFDPMLAAMMAGYATQRPLPPQFEEKLPLFLLLRGFTYLGWIHTRSETDTAKEMGPIVVEGVMALVDVYLG